MVLKKIPSSSLMQAMMKKMFMTLLLMSLNAKRSSRLIHEIPKMIKHFQPMAAHFVKLTLKWNPMVSSLKKNEAELNTDVQLKSTKILPKNIPMVARSIMPDSLKENNMDVQNM